MTKPNTHKKTPAIPERGFLLDSVLLSIHLDNVLNVFAFKTQNSKH